MTYMVQSPGSCGEFIQGYVNGSSFMVACPINRYSMAWTCENDLGNVELLPKSKEAMKKVIKYLGKDYIDVPVSVLSEIVKGKGLASSTADITAVSLATSLFMGNPLTEEDLTKIAISIEPSDATFMKGLVQFDYRKGILLKRLGNVPSMQIMIYDCGGEVDTMQFNGKEDLVSLQMENEPIISKALQIFEEGLVTGNLDKIGQATTISAYANQKILYKKQLDMFHAYGAELGAKGVVCAHSGTILGLIFPNEAPLDEIKSELDIKLNGEMTFLDLVHTTNEGITYKRCDKNEIEQYKARWGRI